MSKDFVFDPETGDLVPSKDFLDRVDVTPLEEEAPLDVEVVPEQFEDDALEGTPGGTDAETLQPPDTFYAQTPQSVRVNPDGSVVVDIVLIVEDGRDSSEYEVRVTK